MSLSSFLGWGAVAGLGAMVIMFVFVRDLRLAMLYAASLPACVLAYLLVAGRTGLGSPSWLDRPLMYATLAPAAVTVVILLLAGGVRVRNSPLDRWFVADVAYHLTWLFTAGCMLYAVVSRNHSAIWWHALGGVCGMVVAFLMRRKFPRPPSVAPGN